MLTPKIAIVILNWNGAADTLECLRSVCGIEYSNFEILVVDNGSTDGSVEAIRQYNPSIRIIETGGNLGYAAGNNVGIRVALKDGSDFVLLLNNDTIVDSALVKKFVVAAGTIPNAGILGAKIYFYSEKKKISYAGGKWKNIFSGCTHIGEGVLDDGQSFNRVDETDFVTGCALFIRREVIEAIGLLDERFFLTFEDTDWYYRARRRGYQCIFVPSSIVWHKVAASFAGENSPLRVYFSSRNRLLWAEKHLNWLQRVGLHVQTYGVMAKHFLHPIFSTGEPINPKRRYWEFMGGLRSPLNKARLFGVRDFWLRRFGNCPDEIRKLNLQWIKTYKMKKSLEGKRPLNAKMHVQA